MDEPYIERIGGSYLRDKHTGALKRVEGTSNSPAQAAADGAPAEGAPAGSDDQSSQEKPSKKGK